MWPKKRSAPWLTGLILALGVIPVSVYSRSNPLQGAITLQAGETLTENLKGGNKLSFEVSLTAGQLARFAVEQHGILLRVTLLDPANAPLVAMDSPSGAHGPIYLSTIANASGKFRLEVQSPESWSNPGTFEVSLTTADQPKPEDSIRIQAETSFAKGMDLVESRSYEQGMAELDRALTRWQSLNDKHWEAVTQFARGSAYRRWGKRKEAGDCLAEALKVPNPQFETNDWRLKASILNDLGSNYSYLNQSERALSTLKLAFEIYEAHGDRRGQASSLSNMGLTYLSLGEPYSALPLFETALKLRHEENDRRGAANMINSIGGVYDTVGDPYKALEYYLSALKEMQAVYEQKILTDPAYYAIALNNVGIAYDKLGDSGMARDYYEQSLLKASATDINRAATLDSMGELYAGLGDGERAKYYYDLAIEFWNSVKQPNPNLKANLLIHIGQYYLTEDDLTEALHFFQSALDLKPNAGRQAEALTFIGVVQTLQNNPQPALAAFKRALDIQVDNKNRRGEAITRQKQGETYALSGQRAEAGEELERALNLWRLVQDRRGEAATLNSIARLELDQDRLNEALQHSEQAIKIIESLRTKITSHQLRTSYFATRENYYALNVDLNMRLYERTRDKQYLAAALQASERSRARSLMDVLNESSIQPAEGLSPDLLKLARDLQLRVLAKSQAQTKLLSQKFSDKDVATINKELVQLVREREDVMERIKRSSPRYAQLTEPEPIGLSGIQQLLDNDTLLLEFATGDTHSHVWVVGKNSIASAGLPARQDIEAIAQRIPKALAERNHSEPGETAFQRAARLKQADAEYSRATALLSQMLFDPIAQLLGQKRLLIVSDGTLQLVPFAALTAPKDVAAATTGAFTERKLLIEDHEIIALESASVLALQRKTLANRKPASQAVAVLANAVFQDSDPRVKRLDSRKQLKAPNHNQQPETKADVSRNRVDSSANLTRALRDVGLNEISWLRYSLDEARAITKVAPPQATLLATDFKASRTTAMSPQLANYRIVHFATHGIVDLERPQFSGIILSMVDENGNPQDGYIRLYEIYNMNLPAELVVLSACETGVGKQIKGEGVMALTRGFMYAGAARVVSSLWKVDDLATAQLMAEFYKEMFSNHQPPSAALRNAQLTMSKDKRWQSPYYWAGFVLQGDWR